MAEKKKLHLFLNDMLKLSCVKGFKYFAIHMRGREEMMCSIVNEPSVPIILSATNSPATSFAHHQGKALPMTHKLQRRLSGYGFINVGLPPASPSENEDGDDNHTLFLIAGYSRYNRPYVWVRTNHERLVRLASEEEKDYPLLLQTTSQWQEREVKIWDVLTELIGVCSSPCPSNPFAVDFDYFESLQVPEKVLASSAILNFLRTLVTSGAHCSRKVQSDLVKMTRLHFQAVLGLWQDRAAKHPPPTSSHPITSQQQQQQQQQQPWQPPLKETQLNTQSSPSQSLEPTHPASLSASRVLPSSRAHVQPPHHPLATYTSVGHPQSQGQPSNYAPGVHSGFATGGSHVQAHPHPPGEASSLSYTSSSLSNVLPSHGQSSGPPAGSSSGGQFYSRRMAGTYMY